MSVSYIVAAIILAIVFTSVVFVFIGKIEHKGRKINLAWLLMMLLIATISILTMVLIYHSQNDLTVSDLQIAYNNGYKNGKAEAAHTFPSNEEVENWLSSTEEVIISTHKDGSDPTIHIIDQNGEEWVLVADEITNNG